ncbi:hypothetical protein JYT72_02075 [Crocinitomix catalasitica]|nr:hypothetical protein [Crocinitomix catalasitica]
MNMIMLSSLILPIILGCGSGEMKEADMTSADSITVNLDSLKTSEQSEQKILWSKIDSLNELFPKDSELFSDSALESAFREALEIATSNELSNEFEKLRGEAYESDNFEIIDGQVERCLPAIHVLIMGESNNIGVSVTSFKFKCDPESSQYVFLELAEKGFYTRSNEYCFNGIAEFPAWIERTGASYQGEAIQDSLSIYKEKWQDIREEQSGFFISLVDITSDCISGMIE